MILKVKKLRADARLPTKKSVGAAAYDLFAVESYYLLPGSITKIKTGLSFEVPQEWKVDIYPRSGLSFMGILIPNAPGKIDSDYRGEIIVLLHNTTSKCFAIQKDDSIAQMELNPVHEIQFVYTDNLSETERGSGGFGSTGR